MAFSRLIWRRTHQGQVQIELLAQDWEIPGDFVMESEDRVWLGRGLSQILCYTIHSPAMTEGENEAGKGERIWSLPEREKEK